jgi:spermidine synthase
MILPFPTRTPYMTSIEISEERGVRYLHFGTPWIQGAMRIARPWSLELEYTREMMMPLLLRTDPQWPGSVLQVGLGAASLTKFLYRYRPDASLCIVEILPEVVAAARQFFKLPNDPARLAIEIADGYDYLAVHRARFDLILVDGFDGKGRTGRLDSASFYLNCRQRLNRGGIMAINLLRRSVKTSVERMREAFGEHVLVLPTNDAGNTIALAGRGPSRRASLAGLPDSVLSLKAETGLNLSASVARLHARSGGKAQFLL